jgi:CSLREA domain-containing protein
MAVLLIAYNASPARAIATTEVNTTADTVPADDGVCTLREAITSANRNTPSGEEIGECTGTDDILISTTGTVRLTEALPDLESDISIKGPGAGQFRISRSSGGDYRIFHVTSGTQVSISGMSISNGNVSGNGGGILNDGGTLTLRDFAVFANVAESDGGGIANNGGILTLIDSRVSINTAEPGSGGGIANLETP